MWCDEVSHIRKDCGDFAEALRNRVVYQWEGRVYAGDTRRALNRNDRRGGMKRLMEEASAQHAETVHYSVSAGTRVGGNEARKDNKAGFWPTVLEGLAGARLRIDEADRAKRRVQEITGWSDPVEEKTGFVEAARQNYEALVEEKRVGNPRTAGPSQRYET